MLKDTIAGIEAKIHAEFITAAGKAELLKLLNDLKAEAAVLEKNHAASLQAHASLKKSTEDLRSSIAGFEQSHPKLVQAVNSISNTLSSFGI
jgi:malonyl CoA-acyl carrier protein transacylase